MFKIICLFPVIHVPPLNSYLSSLPKKLLLPLRSSWCSFSWCPASLFISLFPSPTLPEPSQHKHTSASSAFKSTTEEIKYLICSSRLVLWLHYFALKIKWVTIFRTCLELCSSFNIEPYSKLSSLTMQYCSLILPSKSTTFNHGDLHFSPLTHHSPAAQIINYCIPVSPQNLITMRAKYHLFSQRI